MGLLSWIVMDMLISIMLLYAFKRPIDTLLELMSKKCLKLSGLVMKCLILCWISILLNVLSLCLYLWKHIATVIEISLPVVCICVVFMHVTYDDKFKKYCCLCTRCYLRCVSSAIELRKQQMEQQLANSGVELADPSDAEGLGRASSGSFDGSGRTDSIDIITDPVGRSPSGSVVMAGSATVTGTDLNVVAEDDPAEGVDGIEAAVDTAVDALGSP